MIIHSRSPFNAEPPLSRLRAAFVTAAADFYVRCHGDVPRLDAATHRLVVDGRVGRRLDLGLADLQSIAPARDVAAVLQCAGNRRADLQPVARTSGDPWDAGAIGHAVWTGVPLVAILRAAGADFADTHIQFEAADEFEPGTRYGASIRAAKACDEDVIVAWAMNGAPLSAEHGHPLRVVVPGYAGVRSPKWLTAIRVAAHASDSPIQAADYHLLPPGETDIAAGLLIDELPLNAAICEPARNARLAPGGHVLRGYAAASARSIARVDVSADGGRHWRQAVLEPDATASRWSWTFWSCPLDLAPGEHELVARAWDSAGQTQPADPADVWNQKGYLCAAWHRVAVTVVS